MASRVEPPKQDATTNNRREASKQTCAAINTKITQSTSLGGTLEGRSRRIPLKCISASSQKSHLKISIAFFLIVGVSRGKKMFGIFCFVNFNQMAFSVKKLFINNQWN